MNFFDNYYNVGKTIKGKAARQEYFTAVIEYYYSGGQEPVFKSEQAKTGFEGVRFSLDKSLRNSNNRRKTKAERNANETRTKTDAVHVSSREEEEEEEEGRVTTYPYERTPDPFEETDDEDAAFAAEALAAYNEITGKNELYLAPEAFMALKRIRESGRSIEDVRAVVEVKKAEWEGSAKMRPQIKPTVLFSGRFESYLSQAREVECDERRYDEYAD